MAPEGPLTEETAAQVIQTWLSTKSAALGSEHKVDQFKQILAEPALSTWRQRAQTAKQDNAYWQYKHSLKVNSVKTVNGNPDRSRIEAAVNEVAQLYQGGQLNQGSSYNENLRVQYELVRKEGRWLIKDMAVIR
ncbi:MAG: ARC6/PARC6 family protein [Potamolinea sp.]